MDIGYIATVLAVILVSMTLHEAMHGFMAYWLGDDTAKLEGRLTLNPIKHLDPFLSLILPLTLALVGAPVFGGAKPVPYNPRNVRYGEWGAALVALAGPATNFIIAFVSFGVYAAIHSSGGSVLNQIIVTTVTVNLGFFVFNILPVPPLDGSRVIYALAPEFVRRGMEMVERFGLVLIFILVIFASSAIGNYMGSVILGILQVFARIFGVT